ncbi:MAG TPA: TetR family transcriptional regulator [Tetrasphaera sp.]|nr:TetR family transcriptional regulator [Tetrasphaera sp.]
MSARVPLTKDRLFARALAIVDADGLDALTMRRLASEFGVEAASLYHHVSGKGEVLDGALALMRREMTFADPLPQDWPDLMEVVFVRYLEVLMSHPHLLPLAGRHLESDPAEGLPYLVAQGLPVAQAVELWQGLMAVTVGFAVFATRSFERQSAYLGGELAEAMATWSSRTARHTIRHIIAPHVAGSRVDETA